LGETTIGKTIFTYVYIKKIFFSRTSTPISIKLGTKGMGILNCSNIGPDPLQRGDNCKNGVGSFKNLLQNHSVRIGHIYMKTF
jgi:hypothetical protein